jgi:hypothetical protein
LSRPQPKEPPGTRWPCLELPIEPAGDLSKLDTGRQTPLCGTAREGFAGLGAPPMAGVPEGHNVLSPQHWHTYTRPHAGVNAGLQHRVRRSAGWPRKCMLATG